MSGGRRGYLSYLLCLWQASDGETLVWRASLESPSTRERQGFASLEVLFDFLESQIMSQNEQDLDCERGGGNREDRGAE